MCNIEDLVKMVNPNFTTSVVGSTTESTTANYDKSAIIQRLNDDMAHLMIPATVYISVLMVLGLVGNLMVCYYYGFKTRRTTNSFFIVVLALYDLTVCVFCMPTEIADIELFYTFENNVACKILRFVNYLASIGSILTLIAIATDRFKKICKVTAPQMTIRTTKIISMIVFGAAVLLSWPSLFIYGSIKVNIPNDLEIELKGSDCTSTKDRQYRKYVWAFNIVHFVMFFICSIVLIVLYSIIGHTIYRHHKRMRKYKHRVTTTSSSNETSLTTTSAREDNKLEDIHVPNDSTDKSKTEHQASKPEANSPNESKQPEAREKKTAVEDKSRSNTIDSETIKLTMIMIVVTVVFIISFLPYLSLTVWRVYKGKHEAEFLSGGGLVGFKIGSRSFLLNNTLNPWIYGIFNSNFRRFFFGWLHCKRPS